MVPELYSAKIPDSVGMILGRGGGLVQGLLPLIASLTVEERALVRRARRSPITLGIVDENA